jgi:hypothetical protein
MKKKMALIGSIILLGLLAIQNFFPPSQNLTIPPLYLRNFTSEYPVGASSYSFRQKLTDEGFVIAKKRGEKWFVGDSQYSYPNRNLLRELSIPEECGSSNCKLYWAYALQDSGILSFMFAHSYRYLWVENNGVIIGITDDHSLWHGKL